jgi:hypothetical protein
MGRRIHTESGVGVRGGWRCVLLTGLALAGLCLGGCQLIGGAIELYRKDATHEIKAENTGLKGKTFAVVVSADRMIQADYPELVEYMCKRVTERLADNKNEPRAGGYVPADQVLRYLYDNPSWPSKTMVDLAKGLGGVDRIVYIELNEYRLHEPGNSYEWSGVAAGTVALVEIDSPVPETFAFEKVVSVTFPDEKGYGPTQMPQNLVSTALAARFIDRASWVFYDHQEPYYPKY